MREPQLLGIGARHFERLVIALASPCHLAGVTPAPLPLAERGTGKLQLPGGISIFISRVGPDVFFALSGAGVLTYGLHQAVQLAVTPRRGGLARGGGGRHAGADRGSEPPLQRGPERPGAAGRPRGRPEQRGAAGGHPLARGRGDAPTGRVEIPLTGHLVTAEP
jgi:hypothetical protein